MTASPERPVVLVYGSFAAQGVPCGVTAAVDGLLDSPIQRDFVCEKVGIRNDAGGDGKLLRRLVHGARLFATALARIRRARASVVDIHAVSGREFLKNAAVLLAARSLRVPVVLRIHGGDFDRAMDLGVPAARPLVRFLLRRPQRVVVLSQGWAERIRALEPEARVAVVPNSIDGGVFDAIAARRRDDARDVLLLGNLCERKGHYDALEAFAGVASRHGEVRLIFAGAERDAGALGEIESRARALGIRERLDLTGPVFGKQKDEVFERAGILILPSHVENMPLSIMEGMASSLPVVASRVGATPEMIEDGVDGLLIAPHDVDALTERLDLLLSDAGQRRELGDRARARAFADWDRGPVAQRTAALYREVMR